MHLFLILALMGPAISSPLPPQQSISNPTLVTVAVAVPLDQDSVSRPQITMVPASEESPMDFFSEEFQFDLATSGASEDPLQAIVDSLRPALVPAAFSGENQVAGSETPVPRPSTKAKATSFDSLVALPYPLTSDYVFSANSDLASRPFSGTGTRFIFSPPPAPLITTNFFTLKSQ